MHRPTSGKLHKITATLGPGVGAMHHNPLFSRRKGQSYRADLKSQSPACEEDHLGFRFLSCLTLMAPAAKLS